MMTEERFEPLSFLKVASKMVKLLPTGRVMTYLPSEAQTPKPGETVAGGLPLALVKAEYARLMLLGCTAAFKAAAVVMSPAAPGTARVAHEATGGNVSKVTGASPIGPTEI